MSDDPKKWALAPNSQELAQRALTAGELILERSRKYAEHILSQPPTLPFTPYTSHEAMSHLLAAHSGADLAQTLVRAHQRGEKADLGALAWRMFEHLALAMILGTASPTRA